MPLSEIGSGAGDLLAGQGTAAVVATVGTLAEKAAASLEPARGIPKASSSRAKPILLQAVAARRELKRLRRCGLNPFHPKMARPRGGLALSLWLGHLRRKTL